jgi:hypothetical protein
VTSPYLGCGPARGRATYRLSPFGAMSSRRPRRVLVAAQLRRQPHRVTLNRQEAVTCRSDGEGGASSSRRTATSGMLLARVLVHIPDKGTSPRGTMGSTPIARAACAVTPSPPRSMHRRSFPRPVWRRRRPPAGGRRRLAGLSRWRFTLWHSRPRRPSRGP